MFVGTWVVVTLFSVGCSPQYILRMSSPEQANVVALFDSGERKGNEDDAFAVLDQRAQIKKAAMFFESLSARWRPLSGDPPAPRYEVAFRKGDKVTDRFWLRGNVLCLRTPEGKYFTCEISEREQAELMKMFRFTADSKSLERERA
jgi:hypothetical protein